ncbi:MAG TPA: hypothetical protein VMF53_10355 [Alphaproteobacteria bacterium]|nr:hypothetical protein [Alphaproteobacteria bacterium]
MNSKAIKPAIGFGLSALLTVAFKWIISTIGGGLFYTSAVRWAEVFFGIKEESVASWIISNAPPFVLAVLIIWAAFWASATFFHGSGPSLSGNPHRPLQIGFGTDQPYETTTTYAQTGVTRTVNISLLNNSERIVTECKLTIEEISPVTGYSNRYLLRDHITIPPQNSVYVAIAAYNEGRGNVASGQYIHLIVPTVGGYINSGTVGNVPIGSYNIRLRAATPDGIYDEAHCCLWIDEDGRLRLQSLSSPSSNLTTYSLISGEWRSGPAAVEDFAKRDLIDIRDKWSNKLEEAYLKGREAEDAIAAIRNKFPNGNIPDNSIEMKEYEAHRRRLEVYAKRYDFASNELTRAWDELRGDLHEKLINETLVAKGFRVPHVGGNPEIQISPAEWRILTFDNVKSEATKTGSNEVLYTGLVIGKKAN